MALLRRQKGAQSDFFPGFTDIVEIGIGSLATVYRAREIGTNRLVALKLLNVRDASPRAIESFERESVALGAVSSHPNIVTLYRSFRAGDGRPVLVLELCSGAISDRMRDGQGLPVPEVVGMGIKIAGALETAHRAEILHRDVKPQNILITEFGEPALADFGVAMLQSSTQTTAGLFDFTTLHAAPELLEGGETSAATDVYELASSLYQLIAGRSAFRAYEGESPASVILRILRDPVQPLAAAHVPPPLSDLLISAMSKDKAARPPTAAEFAGQLATIETAQVWPRTQFLIRDVRSPGTTPGAPAVTRMPMLHPRNAPPVGMMSIGSLVPDEPHLADEPAPPVRIEPAVAPPPPPTPPPAPPVQLEPPSPVRRDEPTIQVPAYLPPAPAPDPVPPAADPGWSEVALSGPAPEPPAVPRSSVTAPWPAAALAPWTANGERHPVRIDGDTAAEPPAPEPPPTPAMPAMPAVPAMPAEAPVAPEPPPAPVAPEPRAEELAVRRPIPFPVAPGPWRFEPPAEAQQYPIPPAAFAPEPAPAAVPIWAHRTPAPGPAPSGPPQFVSDLTLDPMSLRRRVTIRSGAAALTADESRLVLRVWWRRREIPWSEVFGFEPRFDGVSASGSGGRLVALTPSGPVDLPATKRAMADLRYVHALLDAYRQRAQLFASR